MRSICLLVLVFVNSWAFAQKISGVITDLQHDALPGAYVTNVTKGSHAHSDELGRFHLEVVGLGDTLSVSYIGFKTQQLVVSDLKGKLEIELAEHVVELSELTVTPDLNAIQALTKIDLNTSPVTSSQQVLRTVPGLMIGQHAGGGKAEQIFLRGFDIDHGTDFNMTVDGMPVNMVSHAHGQGYSDLHFLIPELIQDINFGKGPYNASKGNFTTAGYANIRTKSSLDASSIQVEGGQFNSFRTVGLFNLLNDKKQSAYLATAYNLSDGPFESAQNFSRINLMGKYNAQLGEDRIGLQFSHFTSSWTASGQIPQRAVESGQITRFGAIDDTEGGSTGRSNLKLDYIKTIDDRSFISNQLYYGFYDFELYSNFTFFLEDSINGDQIRQKENRQIMMATSEYNRSFDLGRVESFLKIGGSIRNDIVEDIELSHTANRVTTLEQIQFGDINETNLSAYAQWDIEMGKWLVSPMVRYDYFKFNYDDGLAGRQYFESQGIASPKLNMLYNHSSSMQLYFKSGFGFHSNDSRAITTGETDIILPRAFGYDLGFILKPTTKSFLNVAFWSLDLEQELLYVGDAGIVERGGETHRYGVDVSYRYQLTPWLFFNQDVNYTHARSVNDPEGQNYVPLAPGLTASGGLGVARSLGFYGGIRYRYMADRPANEDNSIVASGYTVVDMNVGYQMKNYTFGVNIENLFNTEWNETQFATESRMQNEPTSVEEIHFTPGTPFSLRAFIKVNF
ncbi:MAG: TonB-dependent receptor plug domain-containing protein [Reichenbachiella sp.]|uniref:TonB-dependent receptor n=1 Tax=Reichenbachiella sp. TaxID=2184521 RepID=UPI0029673538|nr:TonB-dependent receptor plug domain-containing protein [Reichenbachiella sp.]MDW3209422.1 TonB-dependent receptor plug domain-containing protein [Reichenbachiella sp.]